jgi:hypothetical protein
MNRKGKYAAVLAGLTVIGGGAYAATGLADSETEKAPVALPAAVGSISPSPAVSPPSAPPNETQPAVTSALPGPTVELGKEDMERLAAAKKAGEDDVKAQRALPQMGPAATEPIQVEEEGSVRENGKMLRVVSAKQDLSDHHELGWVAGTGKPVGKALCSQKVKLSNESEARTRPTMLICWRVSPERSVYTVLVDIKKKPSAQESVKKINEVWAEMN